MKNFDHFWQGDWIDDAELEKRLSDLPRVIEEHASQERDIEPLLAACDHLAKKLSEDSDIARELTEIALDRNLGESQSALKEVAELLKRENLLKKLRRELSSENPFLASRTQFSDSVFENWAPLGFVVHISPQNSFATGPMSVLEGLLTGNLCFLKTSASESLFPQRFLAALAQLDPTGILKKSIIVARISSKKRELLEKVFQHADAIAAWGGEESIASIRKMAPTSAKVIEWGHKISFAYLTRKQAFDPASLQKLATEICLMDQQACSSPQCVYLDTSDWNELEHFSEKLAIALDLESHKSRRGKPDLAEAAEISMTTEAHRVKSCLDQAQVMESPRGDWRILVDGRGELATSPLYRTIWVKPLPRTQIVHTLRPMRKYLQTAALACDLSDARELSQKLIAAGVLRIRRLGEMTSSYAGEPHDGEYALQKYARRISYQLSEPAQGISSFDELHRLSAPAWVRTHPVTRKEEFGEVPVNESKARLFFKSGGTTGEPKLSKFSYEQYHEHMRLGAEGLYAAGLDPTRDRTINLFFSGGLYGGFVSFFSALELLEVVQFPMAAHTDFEMVAKTIVSQKINTLLGMPSYILQLFEQQSPLLSQYRGVEKIFYGGEHFSEAQRKHLQEKFGVKLIRSGVYGSTDIGPIGFQCPESEDGVHHLQQKLQYLEILKMDQDLPVEGTEAGRLIFSPRNHTENRPLRYEIGDVGHWIEGACACGRASPRFKLLGRMGDVIRIGATFLNYRKFTQILSEQAGYHGEVQFKLDHDGLKERVHMLISETEKLSTEDLTRICLENYSDLRDAVQVDQVLIFETTQIPPTQFQRTRGSGKLIHFMDARK